MVITSLAKETEKKKEEEEQNFGSVATSPISGYTPSSPEFGVVDPLQGAGTITETTSSSAPATAPTATAPTPARRGTVTVIPGDPLILGQDEEGFFASPTGERPGPTGDPKRKFSGGLTEITANGQNFLDPQGSRRQRAELEERGEIINQSSLIRGQEMLSRQQFATNQLTPLIQELERLAIDQPSLKTEGQGFVGNLLEAFGKANTLKGPLQSVGDKALLETFGADESDMYKLRGALGISALAGIAGFLTPTITTSAAAAASKFGNVGSFALGAILLGGSPTSIGQDKIDTASQLVSEIDSGQDQLRGNLDAGMSPQIIVKTVQQQQQQLLEWEAFIKQRSIANISFRTSREYEVLQQEIANARNNMAETLRAAQNTLLTGEKDVDPAMMTYFTNQLNETNSRIEALTP